MKDFRTLSDIRSISDKLKSICTVIWLFLSYVKALVCFHCKKRGMQQKTCTCTRFFFNFQMQAALYVTFPTCLDFLIKFVHIIISGISDILEAYLTVKQSVSSDKQVGLPHTSVQEKANVITNHFRAGQTSAVEKIQDALHYLTYVVLSTSMPTVWYSWTMDNFSNSVGFAHQDWIYLTALTLSQLWIIYICKVLFWCHLNIIVAYVVLCQHLIFLIFVYN